MPKDGLLSVSLDMMVGTGDIKLIALTVLQDIRVIDSGIAYETEE